MNKHFHNWDAKSYSTSCQFVSRHGQALLELLKVKPNQKTLDLGCGTGELGMALTDKGAEVIGVDASPEMVKAACERGLDARIMDGHRLTFENEFDAVFSNAALHWMTDPDAVLHGVARALCPGGVFVAEMGGHGNVAAVHGVLRACLNARGYQSPAPWYFPQPEQYAAKLAAHGFRIDAIDLIPRPTQIQTSLEEWIKVLAGPFVAKVPTQDVDTFINDVCESLSPVLRTENGDWVVDYVRLRFQAQLNC